MDVISQIFYKLAFRRNKEISFESSNLFLLEKSVRHKLKLVPLHQETGEVLLTI